MLPLSSEVKLVKKERNSAAKNEIRETLQQMRVGTSFEVSGPVKKGTVKTLAIAMNIKVKFGKDEAGKVWCTKI
jgi:hypothetical protein